MEAVDLEIFVITNGRKTFPYCMTSLEEQSAKCKITIIQDKKWVDALNECSKKCKSQYFLRVDDDMVLHKFAVAWYASRIKKLSQHRVGVYVCRLWEEWSKKPVNGLRMYASKITSKVHFRASKLGKVDKTFRDDMRLHGWRQAKDGSVVGIHVLADKEDQEKYRALWRQNARLTPSEFAKTFDNKIHDYYKDIPHQCVLLKNIRKLNKKYGTPRFLAFFGKERDRQGIPGA